MLEVIRPIPAHQLRLLVFDLDGTLVDSRKDLSNSVNAMLITLGQPVLPEEVIASFIGDGAGMLVRRALGDPADEALVDHALRLFLDSYRQHKLDHTYVYEGVLSSLDRLAGGAGGWLPRMAVLTNKPVRPAEEICAALGLAPYFFALYGGNSFPTKKPHPQGLLQLMQEAGAGPEETLMVGDSEVDVLTARAAGAWSLGCRFGLSPHTIDAMRDGALVDVVVDHAHEWLPALEQTQATGSRPGQLSEQGR